MLSDLKGGAKLVHLPGSQPENAVRVSLLSGIDAEVFIAREDIHRSHDHSMTDTIGNEPELGVSVIRASRRAIRLPSTCVVVVSPPVVIRNAT